MGRFAQILGWEESEEFVPIQADSELFDELRHELPSEPMIQLQPRKDNPGIEHGAALVDSLYHYREDKYGKNASPVNSFEIWFDQGELRFYFHPDTQQQKNSAMKHFEDKFPGTRMTEETDPFPQINEGDFISGAQLTLTEHFARPLRMLNGPHSFDRDPFASLSSEMVVEGERTPDGEIVRSEDVRMVVQVVFQPASRDVSRGGLFGTNFSNYADKLKKPKMKEGTDQTMRMLFGLEPEERPATQKMKKTAKIIEELQGEPAYLFRLRVITISPYPRIAQQHTRMVSDVFERFYNPITEQGFETMPQENEMLQEMLKDMAARRMCYSSFGKMFAMKDVLSIPELAGLVHLPNEDIEAPEVNWTNLQKGSGVPTTTPDLDDVDDALQQAKQAESSDSGTAGRPGATAAGQPRERTLDEMDLEADGSKDFDLTIDSGDEPNEVLEEESTATTRADGQGLATDEVLSDLSEDENKENEESDSDSSSGIFGLFSKGGGGNEDDAQERTEPQENDVDTTEESDGFGNIFNQEPEETEAKHAETDDLREDSGFDEVDAQETDEIEAQNEEADDRLPGIDEEVASLERDWEATLKSQNQPSDATTGDDNADDPQQPPEPVSEPQDHQGATQPETERSNAQEGEDEQSPSQTDADQDQSIPQTQDDLPPGVLEKLEEYDE